jgi:beta-glucanase (GH16 family)
MGAGVRTTGTPGRLWLSALFLIGMAPALQASQWADEFNGSGAVDGATWSYDTGAGGWGNNELQNYTNTTSNVNQAGGALSITARCCHTSGRIKTQGKKTFVMGDHVEVRLRGPMGQGLWPAAWALGNQYQTGGASGSSPTTWPGCGEIDIMEHINNGGNTFGTIHWWNTAYAYYTAAQPGVNFTSYNTYSIDWVANAPDPVNPGPMIIWKLNGGEVGRAAVGGINGTDEFSAGKPFFVLLNLAVGGSWPGNPDGSTVFPASMDVDYVRVFPVGGTPAPTATGGATPTTGPTPTQAPSGDFTQSVASTGSSTAQARFIPNGYTAGYVILHFTPPGIGQQNVNMVWNSGTGRWEHTMTGLTSGAVVPYWFTYQKNGTQLDSAQFSYTHSGGSATPTATTGTGTVVTLYQNSTYGGTAATFPVGNYTLSNIISRGGANDWASSIRVTSGYCAILYADDNFSGTSKIVTADQSSLSNIAFNDMLSSMRVQSGTCSGATPTRTPTATATTVGSTPTSGAGCPAAWTTGVFYSVGTQVSYGGIKYSCTQAHTSQVSWEPPNAPSLWSNQGSCSGGSTPTRTPTSGATPTRTATATATQSCTGTTINPYLQVNGGTWQNTANATVSAGSTVKFGPQPTTGGSWLWSTGATTREITVTVSTTTSYTATYTNSSGCKSTLTFTITVTGSRATATPTSLRATPTQGTTPTPAQGCIGCTHKRLKIISGCAQPMWIQHLEAGGDGGSLNSPNFRMLSGVGSFVEYDIPDKGIAGVRFWPGFGCDGSGHNCTIGASGGPASLGFTCPPQGCSPPIDSKFEGTFGCIPGVPDSSCQGNPSGGGAPLGRGDWWNSSFVDGYTVPMKVQVIGSCPVGPQPAPVYGPGGPPGGQVSCTVIRNSDCPTNENLSSNGQYPNLANVSLRAINPANGQQAGCYSPSGKLTFSNWAAYAGFTTYPPTDPHAMWYACPTPPISPDQCMAGPAASTAYTNMIHTKCQTYAYPYDDHFGLASCPSASNLRYEVTFMCPQ